MARVITLLAIFFIAMNAFAGVLMSQGIVQTANLNSVDQSEELSNDVPSDEVASGAPTGSTLFGMYNVLAGQVSGFFGAIFPGLKLLEHAGLPNWMLYGIGAPLFSTITFVGVVSFLRGWGL